MVELLCLAIASFCAFSAVKRGGVVSPASVHVLYAFGCLALFLIITFLDLGKDDLIFTAMPINDFRPVKEKVMAYYLGIIILGVVVQRFSRVRRAGIPTVKTGGKRYSSVNGLPALFVLSLLCVMSVMHFIELDYETLYRNTEYLRIKDPDGVGISSSFGRIYHFLFRFVGLVATVLFLFYLGSRKYLHAVLSAFLSSYSILLLIAGNSRWVPLYFAVAVAYFLFSGKRLSSISVWLAISLMFLSFVKVLLGRESQYQGISEIYNDFAAIQFERLGIYIGGFAVNVFEGSFNFANTCLIEPYFELKYKILSFSPLFSFMDGFDLIRDDLKFKFAPNVPMSAYSEVWFFGPLYFLFFMVFYGYFLLVLNKVFSRGGAMALFLAVPAYYVIVSLHTYSLRTSWRLILVLLVVGLVFEAKAVRGERRLKNDLARKLAE